MKQIDLREGARRQHRAISLFAIIQCWIRGLDGIVFEREDLQRLLGLERFKKTRVNWLEEDLKEFFPHQETFWRTDHSDSFHSLFASRLPLKNCLSTDSMITQRRIILIPKDGPKIQPFEMWAIPDSREMGRVFESAVPFFSDSANYDERFLSAYLSLLSSGQISPHRLPRLQPSKTAEEA